MKQNVDLINDISELRKDVRTLDDDLKKTKNKFKEEKSRLT